MTVEQKKKRRVGNALVGAAGVHYVCMRLSLRGLVATATTRNAAGIDVLVGTPDGAATAALQVKTSQHIVTFWPTPQEDRCPVGDSTFFVFLRWDPNGETFEGFLVPSSRVKDDIASERSRQKERGLVDFPCWYLPREPEAQAELRDAWETWRPVAVTIGSPTEPQLNE